MPVFSLIGKVVKRHGVVHQPAPSSVTMLFTLAGFTQVQNGAGIKGSGCGIKFILVDFVFHCTFSSLSPSLTAASISDWRMISIMASAACSIPSANPFSSGSASFNALTILVLSICSLPFKSWRLPYQAVNLLNAFQLPLQRHRITPSGLRRVKEGIYLSGYLQPLLFAVFC